VTIVVLVVIIVALIVVAVTGRSGGREFDDRLVLLAARVAALEAALRARPAAAGDAAAEARSPVTVAAPSLPRLEAPQQPEIALTAAPADHTAPAASASNLSGFAGIEERLIRRWIVWLGALALALGVVFLVKYSIERGFFGPAARVVAGVVIALALLAAGEWTRRHPPTLPQGFAVEPDYVPPGLSAAGIVGLFASLYAGHALYALIPPMPTFVLLAGVAVAAALLSLAHGRLMALLGFVGAYVVPALVATPHPTAAGLLAYVALVTAGALLLLRWQGWPWLGWTVAGGAMAWGLAALFLADGEVPLGLYLLVIPAVFALLIPAERAVTPGLGFVWAAVALDAALMVALAIVNGYDDTAVTLASALALLVAALGLYDAGYDRMAWIGGGSQLALLAAWQYSWVPPISPASSYFLVAPPAMVRSYLGVALAAALVSGVGGAVVMARAPRPGRWAFVAAAMPVAILVIAYWRVALLAESLPWAAIALALAAANIAAVETVMRRPALPDQAAALAAFAVASVASITLGMTMSLRLGWLTVALSLQLPALVWLYDRTQVRAVRWTAAVLAASVLVRLLLNPSIVDYEGGANPLFNALLYTYGVPWLAFLAATRGFRRSAEDALVWLLESGTIALFVALVSLDIRHALHGTVVSPRYDLLEQGLHSTAWLAIAYVVLARGQAVAHPVRDVAWRILVAAAALNVGLVSLINSNPIWTWDSVGAWPIFDSLLFAYLLPAILAALFHRTFRRIGLGLAARAAGIAALVLGFIYLSLEARHLFQGQVLHYGPTSAAEWYVYSAVWLLYGLGLVVSGLAFGAPELRLAGFAVGAVVAVKVFVFDMAALTGIYRAASFLGLGAVLVSLGYLHQAMSGRARGPASAG
jgi:uncharacterized membrane protein